MYEYYGVPNMTNMPNMASMTTMANMGNSSMYPGAFPMQMPMQSPAMEQQVQTPNLPLYGPQSIMKLVKNIYNSIVDEATAADLYSRLLKETTNELHKEFIKNAMEDEIKHGKALTRLYTYYTGQMPQFKIEPTKYSSYKEGITTALKGEIAAAEFYKDQILSTTDQLVKDTFFLTMVDELEHATQFGIILSSL